MDKKQKTIFYTGIGVFAALVILLVWLIISNSTATLRLDENQAQTDSLRIANEQLQLANEQMALEQEFNQLNADFLMYEEQQRYLQDDSIVQKYNEARMKVEGLLQELEAEKKANRVNKNRIKQLEAEVGTLKGIVRHYLEEIQRLGTENQKLKEELDNVNRENQNLASRVDHTSRQNAQLTETVNLAKKLNITGLTLNAFDKKDKKEKNITKAKKLGVTFTVSPNNTTSPGMKEFVVRIVSPEGNVLNGGGTFTYEGTLLEATARRSLEYSNDELPVSIYWNNNTTLSAGDYTVEVFCDGYRLASRKIMMKK